MKDRYRRPFLSGYWKSLYNIDMEKNGFLFIDKEEGMTSRYVDNRLGKLFQTRKVGHLGTLDPFATGLLIVGINKGTKFFPYLSEDKKTYRASLVLGKKTSSGDKEGEVLDEKAVPPLSENQIEGVLHSFLGKSYQMPPMTSAIKINGKPLYQYAHQNITIERKEREIEIYSIKPLSFDGKTLLFEASVRKGTYIRTLGEDIALRLGTFGYLESLRRIEDANIDVSKAKKLSEITTEDILEPTPFLHFPTYPLSEEEWKDVSNGKKMRFLSKEKKLLLLYGDKAVFIYNRAENGIYIPERGLF